MLGVLLWVSWNQIILTNVVFHISFHWNDDFFFFCESLAHVTLIIFNSDHPGSWNYIRKLLKCLTLVFALDHFHIAVVFG